MALLRILEYARQLVFERVQQGDVVVDATCGNGNDTLFLAELVGADGKVYGFDIQEAAVTRTGDKLRASGLKERAVLIKDSHAKVHEYIDTPVKAAMFNLGYLPGTDKQITTIAETTIASLDSLISLLTTGGIITLVIYHGHDNGYEAKELEAFLGNLDQKKYNVLKYDFINQVNYPPYLIAIERLY